MDGQTQVGNKQIYKVAFTGPFGAGKTSAAFITTGVLSELYGGDNAIAYIIAFANPLKQCSLAFHRKEKERRFLQRIADVAREEFGDDIMERIFTANYESLITNKVPQLHQEHVVIMTDDLRFLNEYKLLKELGFTVIRIDADAEIRRRRLGDSYTGTNHRSEIEMELFEPDFVLYNNVEEPLLVTFESNLKDILINNKILEV